MPKYQVGDRVRVVDTPYFDCKFGWDDDDSISMTSFCGMEATIMSIEHYKYHVADGYEIDIDDGRYTWCDGCFTSAEDIDLIESDMDVTFLLGGGQT